MAKELTTEQKQYLMLVTEQARRLRNVAEKVQLSLAEDTLAALEPDAEVWPGIPSSADIAHLQTTHAKLDILISMRGTFFPANFDATAAEMAERRRLFSEALSGVRQ